MNVLEGIVYISNNASVSCSIILGKSAERGILGLALAMIAILGQPPIHSRMISSLNYPIEKFDDQKC